MNKEVKDLCQKVIELEGKAKTATKELGKSRAKLNVMIDGCPTQANEVVALLKKLRKLS